LFLFSRYGFSVEPYKSPKREEYIELKAIAEMEEVSGKKGATKVMLKRLLIHSFPLFLLMNRLYN
jgi:hypothetical protein